MLSQDTDERKGMIESIPFPQLCSQRDAMLFELCLICIINYTLNCDLGDINLRNRKIVGTYNYPSI